MIDFTDPAVARRWKRRSLAAISLAAAAGIGWYAADPGVLSYQVGYTLALPALITTIVWVGLRVPRWLAWTIAVLIGAGGSVGYILFDGSQWWLAAQISLLPFVLLVITSGGKGSGEKLAQGERWYGGMQDGPWGPP